VNATRWAQVRMAPPTYGRPMGAGLRLLKMHSSRLPVVGGAVQEGVGLEDCNVDRGERVRTKAVTCKEAVTWKIHR